MAKERAHLLAPVKPESGCKLSTIGRGSVGWDILGFLPDELVLGLGSMELVEDRPATLPVELERLNHFVGFERN